MRESSPYRLPDPPTAPGPPSYVAHWKKYRNRWLVVIGMWLGFMPLFGTMDLVLSKFMTDTTSVTTVAHGIYAFAWLITAFRAASLPCPRCRNPFMSNGFFHNAFAQKCMHCGLRRGAPHDPDWKPLP